MNVTIIKGPMFKQAKEEAQRVLRRALIKEGMKLLEEKKGSK